MDIGIVVLPTDTSARIDELAIEAEDRGLTHLYVGGDHTHIPVNRVSPFPGGSDLPEEYKRTYDPLVAITAAAARTSRIRLGTCIHLTAQRDPFTTAKQIASIAAIAPGRIDYGVGYGWNAEEAANHGVEWRTRRSRVREHIGAMRALWTEDEASFSGEYVSFEPVWTWPKPTPQPRVILGAGPTQRTFDAIAAWADGWFPVPFGGDTPAHAAELHRVAAERGRDPKDVAVIVDGVLTDPAMIDPWAEADTPIEAVLVVVPSLPLGDVLGQLDAAAALIDRYR